ncbi:MAG: OmpA family protein [Desulfobacterales bacterium]|jgi:outer membrane protein OmpA-like peptidoglycan-associated protein
MKPTFKALLLMTLALFTLTSCASLETNEKQGTAIGAGVGAAAGAGLGAAIGRDTKSAAIGAAIGTAVGAITGNRIGAYMDRQEQELRDALAYSEAAAIEREQNVLMATFKGDVFFDFDSADLKPGAYDELDRTARVLNDFPATTIRIEGHTDQSGSEDYNQILSEKRAESVKAALVARNVNAARLQTIGFGESKPISSDPAQNRRVTMVITPNSAG